MPPHRTRQEAVLHLRQELERTSFPRLQMGLIVALTGAVGFLCSFALLRGGWDAMAWRYPVSLAVAYGFFLGLLWLWLGHRAEDYADPGSLSDALPGHAPHSPEWGSGRGGDFAGGGAQGSFGEASRGVADTGGGATGDWSVADGDVAAIPVIVVGLAVGMAFASLYVVYAAPVLFAELLFDGVLSYTVYRRLRDVDRRHWLGTALRRTAPVFMLTAVCLAGFGAAMGWYAPGARSIGDVVQHVVTPR